MKFVLKVLVLAFLVVMSKLAKDESVDGQKAIARKAESTPVFTNNIRETPVEVTQPSTFSVKFEKSSFEVN